MWPAEAGVGGVHHQLSSRPLCFLWALPSSLRKGGVRVAMSGNSHDAAAEQG